MERGEQVHGELVSADASTAAAIVLYKAGTRTVRTLGSTEHLVITDVMMNSTAATDVALFDDADADGTIDAGERIAHGDFSAKGGLVTAFSTPRYCSKGITPKVKAGAAGAVKVLILGYILKA